MNRIALFLFLFSVALVGNSKVISKSGNKPQWVRDGEKKLNDKRSNESYYFCAISSEGQVLTSLKENKFYELSSRIGQENKIEGKGIRNVSAPQDVNGKGYDDVEMTFANEYRTVSFYARFVDDYWEYISYPSGEKGYKYYALFAVSSNGKNTHFDSFSISTSYGAAPVAMSLIPGVGQMYKGSTIKGVCMLGGVVALGLGALICENTRSDYKNKMKEQPEFAQTYNTKANNYETARNILIGSAAAVYVYNLIDAAVAKGARRIVVKPANGSYVSLHPIVTPNSAGISLAYNF